MDLQTIYLISQVAAALAVVASLLFVGIELRNATRAIRATSHHAITDSFNAINTLVIDNPRVARIWRLGSLDPAALSDDEAFSYNHICLAYMRIFETLYYQHKNGTMMPELYAAERRTIEYMASFPPFRDYWENNPVSFSDEFRAFVNAMIHDARESGAQAYFFDPRKKG